MIEVKEKFLGTFDGAEVRWPGINGQPTYLYCQMTRIGGKEALSFGAVPIEVRLMAHPMVPTRLPDQNKIRQNSGKL